jgi:hypothetical protein
MSFPNLNPFIETFLDPTRIFLFGKPFPALAYVANPVGAIQGAAAGGAAAGAAVQAAVAYGDAAAPAPPPPGEFEVHPPGRVEQALLQAEEDGNFARIYGFSFEGHYYKMPRPLLFLVRGDGRSRVPEDLPAAPGGSRAFNTRFTGIEGKDWQFADDIRVWAVDKHDIAICLDLEIGNYEQVLLESTLDAQEEMGARSAGASRSAGSSRSRAMALRSAGSFRSAGHGPHQDR